MNSQREILFLDFNLMTSSPHKTTIFHYIKELKDLFILLIEAKTKDEIMS